ncbi:hypothetical protein BK784_38785 [Bacillus thuringiensis serovar medellin]|uniref:Uncharacterized protein n=1 Tax=Bacillus thuringiensis subsp. medellin TaxID=79672 RepID=A0A9X6R7Z4_BACTV|nr:hypothetical protein [Bacillus thuringiensis]OUB82182.1 hypothetical protein BK784_38785 [Bacillus thuringiensis serovar medellin]
MLTVTDPYESSLVTPLGKFKADTFLKQNYSGIGHPSDKIVLNQDVYRWSDYGKPSDLDYYEFSFPDNPELGTRIVAAGYFKNLAAQGKSGSVLIDNINLYIMK